MIHGVLHRWKKDKEYFPSVFTTALSFLEDNDMLKIAPGKYAIDGDRVFALVQDIVTEPVQMRRFELHREYIDIQLVISGKEQQLYAPEPDTGLVEDLLADADIAFYSHPPKYNTIILEPGDYAIYLPSELHCPCCVAETTGKVRKVVFKIRKII